MTSATSTPIWEFWTALVGYGRETKLEFPDILQRFQNLHPQYANKCAIITMWNVFYLWCTHDSSKNLPPRMYKNSPLYFRTYVYLCVYRNHVVYPIPIEFTQMMRPEQSLQIQLSDRAVGHVIRRRPLISGQPVPVTDFTTRNRHFGRHGAESFEIDDDPEPPHSSSDYPRWLERHRNRIAQTTIETTDDEDDDEEVEVIDASKVDDEDDDDFEPKNKRQNIHGHGYNHNNDIKKYIHTLLSILKTLDKENLLLYMN